MIANLREHEAELKAAGVVHLRLHGSLARGAATEVSDVDLIAEFDARSRLSLLDMVDLENRLADLLGVRVDLSPAHTWKEPVAERARRAAVLPFREPALPLHDISDTINTSHTFLFGCLGTPHHLSSVMITCA